jgi:hypothetical protein
MLIIFLFMINDTVIAQNNKKSTKKIRSSAIGNGYVVPSKEKHKVKGTIGQSLSGVSSNKRTKNDIGFWYQKKQESLKKSLVENDNALPTKFRLDQNYPNPFNPSTMIQFSLPKPMLANLELYNLLGQKVKTLLNKEIEAGEHKYFLQAHNLTSGVYFYRFQAGNYVQTKKLTVLK